jgi:nucleoside-diphosphate-sugar epimerase
MRCLIIGGTRVIGPHVVRRMHARGWDVTLLHRGVHQFELPAGVREIRDGSAGIPVVHIPHTARRPEPDVVLHMIAMGEQDAERAMEAFVDRASRIVAPSSGDVIGRTGDSRQLSLALLSPRLSQRTRPCEIDCSRIVGRQHRRRTQLLVRQDPRGACHPRSQ